MKELTHNDLTENLIKETDMQLPSSRREIEEDMLEQICLIANTGIQVTVEELCSRMDMTKREVSFYLKQLNAHGYIIREKIRIQDIRKMELDLEFYLQNLERSLEKNFSIAMKSSRSFSSLLVFQMRKPKRMPAVWNMWSVRKRFSRFVIL